MSSSMLALEDVMVVDALTRVRGLRGCIIRLSDSSGGAVLLRKAGCRPASVMGAAGIAPRVLSLKVACLDS